MMSRKRLIIAGAVFATVAVILAVWVWSGHWSKSYTELAERPSEKASPSIPVKEASLITLNALFPYEILSQALTTALPTEIPIEGRQHVCIDVERQVQQTIEEKIGGDVGKIVGGVARIVTKVVTVGQVQNLCLDIDYRASIRRDSSVIISQIGDAVRLSVPISVDGQAGFAGDLAGFLKLDKKNFRGAITATADVRLGVDENWCPTVSATPDFSWTDKAQLEIAGKFWIDIDAQAGPEIRKAMGEASDKIPSTLTCDRIKQIVQPIWQEYEIALPPIAGQMGQILLSPQRVGFSGLSYTATGAQLAFMLTAQTEVKFGAGLANKASSTSAKPLVLPKLERIPAEQNTLKLAVPIIASYRSIQTAASAALLNKTFEGTTDSASASVTVKEVEVYPSGERLVVGLRFESIISKPEALAPQGWIYVVGKPKFDLATQTLSLTELDFSRIIDNDLWNVLSFLFQSQIRKAIEDSAIVDLRSNFTEARQILRKELVTAAAKDGVNVNLRDDFLGLTRVSATNEGVEIVVRFEGAANVVVLNRPSR